MQLLGFFALAFLLLCSVLAVAVYFALRGNDPAKSRVNGPAGCAIGCALLGVAGIGLVCVLVVAGVSVASKVAEHGRFDQWGIHIEGDDAPRPNRPLERTETPDSQRALRLRVEFDGEIESGRVQRWLRERAKDLSSMSVREENDNGKRRTVIELGLPLDEDELEKLARELERALPELNLPSGVRVEIRTSRE